MTYSNDRLFLSHALIAKLPLCPIGHHGAWGWGSPYQGTADLTAVGEGTHSPATHWLLIHLEASHLTATHIDGTEQHANDTL